MISSLKKYRLVTLTVFAISAGLIWRGEVEYHGWKGLIWIGYFHYAVPIAIALFFIWLNLSVTLKLKNRIGLLLTGLVLSVSITWLLFQSFTRNFVMGPSAFVYLIQDDPLDFLKYGQFVIVPLIPLITAFTSRAFGIKISLMSVIFSTILMIISPDIAVYILDLTNHKGSPNYIHTIKSGYLLGLWFFALGLTFIRSKEVVPKTTSQADLIDQ